MSVSQQDPAPRAERLAFARDAGLQWPESGRVGLLHPGPDEMLPPLPPERLTIVTPMAHVAARLALQGVTAGPDLPAPDSLAAALVCLPRGRIEAQDLIARACNMTAGPVVVDGQKTDGIEAVLKALKPRVALNGPISKGHGKIAWFDSADLSDWLTGPGMITAADGRLFETQPGVFSADGVDPASALLAAAVPADAKGVAVDLGAGWGYLAATVLARCPALSALHLIETDDRALRCARRNVTDPRAIFHWADATALPAAVSQGIRADLVIMNPPFHQGRAAQPGLGAAFIATAAALLKPTGALWLVANRHLPYETPLRAHFQQVTEAGGDGRFKLIRAEAPIPPKGQLPRSRTRHAMHRKPNR